MQTCRKVTFSSEDSTVKKRCSLFFLRYSSTLPSDMNGMIIMGISPSKHSPMSDMTFWCLKESIRDTSFSIFNLSPSDDRAEDKIVHFLIDDIIVEFFTFHCFDCHKFTTSHVATEYQTRLSCDKGWTSPSDQLVYAVYVWHM